MADSEGSNAVSAVAIIAILVLVGLGAYFLFYRGGGSSGGGDGATIEIDVSEVGGSVEIDDGAFRATGVDGALTFRADDEARPATAA